MINEFITILRYCISGIFGVVLMSAFSGVWIGKRRKRTVLELCFITVVSLSIQGLCALFFGMDLTFILYPLHTHAPIMIFFILYYRVPWKTSVMSVLFSYMCLQLPNWLSRLLALIGNPYGLTECLSYLLLCILVTYVVQKAAIPRVRDAIEETPSSALTFSVVPFLYYIFDYVTTIWSDLLYSGNYFVTQFMPTLVSITYMLMVAHICSEQVKRSLALQEKELFERQIAATESEFEALKQMQETTRMYRHDMRHHFSLLLSMAEENLCSDMVDYLKENLQNIEAVTPKHFTDIEMLNLLLSHFAETAEKKEINYTFDIQLSGVYTISSTELCALVSNAIENALNAVDKLPFDLRRLKVKLAENLDNITLLVENPYFGEIVMKNGLPYSFREGHGFGTKSMVNIVKSNGGEIVFSTDNSIFRLMAVLPNKQQVSNS